VIVEGETKMTTSERIRILMVDDHPLFSEGLATVIQHQPDMLPVGQASSGREAIQLFNECSPDVTLMDLRLPDMNGIDAMIAIRSKFSQARFIIFTTFAGDAEIQRAVEAGARAYLLKTMPPQELMDMIRQVHAGKKKIPSEIAAHLTEHYSDEELAPGEVDILSHPAGGNRSRDIAEKVSILGQERDKLRPLDTDLEHVNRVRTLEEMAASLADEIIEPVAAAVTSANSCIEWLAHEPPNLDRVRAAAIRIDKYGNRAAEIINRIRALYKKSLSTT
jgi:DNA-binding NarL/FixJ family response regulator